LTIERYDSDTRARRQRRVATGGIVLPTSAYGLDALRQDVPICPPGLYFIANAPVKIPLLARVKPERQQSLWQKIIHQLRHRAMDLLHHLTKVFADPQISQRVVMVIDKCRHPRHKSVLSRVILEAIPEDILGLLG
jgi:hypothetical protein